jgi:hypothetical protein
LGHQAVAAREFTATAYADLGEHYSLAIFASFIMLITIRSEPI